ncbi:unnamed protein product [Spirodela intermedia]|uniref:Uncharacterized protein n=1 Tax=Spirodela intermedia TaxID=51605 RepID=A0A7I8JSX6_SPIIN|nr:unnamed protein product [Spirodela intermedia]CAA6673276.1 unnamed protein product [Spirodela intermedia]
MRCGLTKLFQGIIAPGPIRRSASPSSTPPPSSLSVPFLFFSHGYFASPSASAEASRRPPGAWLGSSPSRRDPFRRTRLGWASRCPLLVRASSQGPPSSSGQSSAWEREEARWLREEQRWLREEQRWLREESRWNSEREALLRDIAALKLRIEGWRGRVPPIGGLRRRREPRDVAASDEGARGGGGGGGGRRTQGPPALAEEADVKEMILEEITVSEGVAEDKKRRMLRVGAEGNDVRAMQRISVVLAGSAPDAGFYSGEEDMEFETFSSGTERAVKTWQASLGAIENGIMSPELLERLFDEPGTGKAVEGGGNGAAVSSLAGFAEIQKKEVDMDEDMTDVQVSGHRVFLLGENRWEEPSRLADRNRPIGNKGTTTSPSSTRCLTCRGEGRLMCTECDGTGEPNIEPQFLEWVDEGAKCPYCEGRGYTVCDVCGGKAVA